MICIPPNIIRVIKLRRMIRDDIGEVTDSYKIMFEGPEGNKSLWRPRCICKDNIKMDLRERGSDGVHWV
jgi:hypothetical protein